MTATVTLSLDPRDVGFDPLTLDLPVILDRIGTLVVVLPGGIRIGPFPAAEMTTKLRELGYTVIREDEAGLGTIVG